MVPAQASLRCSFCSGRISNGEWTRHFKIVASWGHEARISTFFYGESGIHQDVSGPTGDQGFSCQVNSFHSYTPVNAFIIHKSCLCLMETFLRPSPESLQPEEIFRVCHSLQPGKKRRFGYMKELDLSNCLDPNQPIISSSSSCISPVFRSDIPEKQVLDTSSEPSILLQLPAEVIMMILEALPPSGLIGFFHSSKQCLSYAATFCRQNRLHFYRCIDTKGTIDPPNFDALLCNITPTQYAGLDKRWEIVLRVADIAKHISKIRTKGFTIPTLDRSLLPHFESHPGFEELTVEIDDVKTMKVYMISIHGNHYVSGIECEYESEDTCRIIGNRSSVVKTIDFALIGFDQLRFVVDSLGVRSLKFGNSPWVFGSPDSIKGWEGFSMRQVERKIRVTRDTLKFREISWCYTISPPFEETLVMKEKHALFHGSISEDDFVQKHPGKERFMITKFGKFMTEAIWLDEGICGVTMYCDDLGISGVSLHTLSGAQSVGEKSAMAIFFPIHGPEEVLSEIDVRFGSVHYSGLGIVLKTNWGRQCAFGRTLDSQNGYETKCLRPPQNCHISGIYFRLGEFMAIEALGLIVESGPRGSTCGRIISPLKIPKIISEYESLSTKLYESCAWLSDIQKIWFYFDTDRCTGLRLFSPFNTSEVIGRVQGDHSREITFSNKEKICRIWVTQEGKTVKNIEFETDITESQDRKGTPYEVTSSTAIAWWYLEDIDIVRVFVPETLEVANSSLISLEN